MLLVSSNGSSSRHTIFCASEWDRKQTKIASDSDEGLLHPSSGPSLYCALLHIRPSEQLLLHRSQQLVVKPIVLLRGYLLCQLMVERFSNMVWWCQQRMVSNELWRVGPQNESICCWWEQDDRCVKKDAQFVVVVRCSCSIYFYHHTLCCSRESSTCTI